MQALSKQPVLDVNHTFSHKENKTQMLTHATFPWRSEHEKHQSGLLSIHRHGMAGVCCLWTLGLSLWQQWHSERFCYLEGTLSWFFPSASNMKKKCYPPQIRGRTCCPGGPPRPPSQHSHCCATGWQWISKICQRTCRLGQEVGTLFLLGGQFN